MAAAMAVLTSQPDLFTGAWPDGLTYEQEFLSPADENALLQQLAALPFAAARYKAYEARRRVVSYGGRYDFDQNVLQPAEPMPAFLLALRTRVADALGVDPDALQHALLSEYRPGTPLGWHRDVPDFEAVAGVSLLAACTMRFRPYPPPRGRSPVLALDLKPRSLYVLRDAARWRWQHRIDATPALRYSITFRTLAAPAAR